MTDDSPVSPHLRRAQALERQRQGETRRAAELVRQFAADAAAAGLTPERLTARTYDGRSRLRTTHEGWYLKRDRSVAVGTDGEFYVMSAPRSLRGLVRGVTLDPGEPPLELGRGARDGESMPLTEALAKRLAGGDDWAA
ncbi:hypothetical protein [Demequina muriae]|uniref:Uncharacterized protein n=1 Tax=Demequina muriae TaxID=3051664 RepID=A0ABT8GIN7_9MICO|nr:hypothetical protein [Demequina sp. EGI L300058]MDN4481129.1 hypothetical protein [Demequina sp. EGI L300058]